MNGFLRRRVDGVARDLTDGYVPNPNCSHLAKLETALVHHRSGRMHMAAEIYREILATDPTDKDANYLLAVWSLGTDDFDAAGRLLHQLTVSFPDFSLAWAMFGQALEAVNRLEDAQKAYEIALSIEPKLTFAHYSLGNLAKNDEEFKMAIAHYRQSSGLDPNHVPSFLGIAECFYILNQFEESMSACHRALLVDKRNASAYYLLGRAYLALGQIGPATDSFRTAVKLAPGFVAAYCSLGRCYLSLQEASKALEMCIQAIEIDPDFHEAYTYRGLALVELGRLDEAESSARKAIALAPNSAEAYYVLGCATLNSSRPEESLEFFKKALEIDPNYSSAHSRMIQAMQCCEATEPRELLAMAESWGRRFTSSQYSPVPMCKEIKRIGFIGSDLNLHPIGCYVEGLISNIDREKYQVFVYAHSDNLDSLSQKLKDSVSGWRKILGLDDDTVTTIVREDQIDVLVDLSGHTVNNRLQILANHAAPIQVSWLGHQGTTGLPQIDALVGDRSVTPLEVTGDFAEKLLRLDGPWINFTPPAIRHDVVAPPCTLGEPFTFGVFCHTAKVNRSTVEDWSAILGQVDGSRILLKSRSFVSAALRQQVLDWFSESGIGSERVVFRQSTSWALHFGSFDQVDLMLDTFPFHSSTTTLESLWMGVPVLTREGKGMHSRLSSRILEEVDLVGFVTDSREDYISRTVALANDKDLLMDLRFSLRNRLLTSRLCNCKGFADQFMAALESLKY